MTNNFEVSIVNYLCPICGEVAEEGIIMNSLLTEKNAKAVADLNGKAIGYTDHVCKKCAEYKDETVFFIGIDVSKSTKKEPYRTGHIAGVKKDSPLVEKCKKYLLTLKDNTQYVYIEYEIGKQLGLWKLLK